MTNSHPNSTAIIRYETEELTLHKQDSRRAGRWALWFGCMVSGIWFGLIGMLGFATPILNAFKGDVYVFGALLLALAMPGILIFFAGLFARAQGQAAAANRLVLEAANHLLLPSAAASQAAQSHAQNLKGEAAAIERAMTQAVTVLHSFVGELETRRHSLFEVTGTTVEKTEGLIHKLTDERAALEGLTETINLQLTQIGQSVPKQANILAQALKTAGDEVQSAEEILESRMLAFDAAEDKLVSRMQDIDALAQSTVGYTERLEVLVSQIETRLNDTTKLIDASIKAGELASTAAHATGQALQNAVSDALDGARIASDDIAAKTIESARETASAIKALKRAGQETQTAFSEIQTNAKSTLTGNQHPRPPYPVNKLPEGPVFSSFKHDEGVAATVKRQQPLRIEPDPRNNSVRDEKAADPLDQIEDELFEDVSDTAHNPSATAPFLSVEPTDDAGREPASSFIITDLDNPSEAPIRLSRLSEPETNFDDDDDGEWEVIRPRQVEPSKAEPISQFNSTKPRAGNGSWGDILADVDKAASRDLPPREETAEKLVIAFERNGLNLHNIFKPKDKKNIALAARRGDYARRSAIKESARRFVSGAEDVLKNNPDLLQAAYVFLEYENTDALQALEKTHKSSKNAGVRLAIYLIIDAAVGKARAA